MLEFLHIENIATVKSLDIELGGGMTTLTGETGAGKSIIVDSLNLLNGARADKELLRSGEEKAQVSAIFTHLRPEVISRLEEMGIEVNEDGISIARGLTRTSSSARINGRPVTLFMLKEVSSMLFGIHGQNDNMLLLDVQNHIRILDTYASNHELLEQYYEAYRRVLEYRIELHSACEDAMEQNRTREMLKFQIDDICSAGLKAGEEEKLEALGAKLRSFERINKCCTLVDRALNGGKGMGAIYLTDRAENAMSAIADALPEAEALSRRLAEIKFELEDIAQCASGLCDIEGDVTAQLDKIEERLSIISKLKRKYGSTVEEIIEFGEKAKKRLEDIDGAEDRKIELEELLQAAESRAKELARELTKARQKHAVGLERAVCETLAFLDMPKIRFEVAVTQAKELNANGCDSVEFLICANVGEPLMPLAKIASGGELARIMLSLKNVLNRCDGIDTVVFDEVDTGISGKTSRKVGIKLKEIGKSTQVLCVTHSPQIASICDSHLFVSKCEVDGRTQSSIKRLEHEERVKEVARILGGIQITEIQLAAAREMIAEGEKY